MATIDQGNRSGGQAYGQVSGDTLRIQLIDRLCRLRADALSRVELLIGELEAPAVSVESLDNADEPQLREVSACSGSTNAIPVAQPLDWPHSPLHRLSERGTYIVTAGTFHKLHHFRGSERLTFLEATLFKLAERYHIALEAWAIFSNHYHFIGHCIDDRSDLHELISHLHSESARFVNKLDHSLDRQVWFNFWDTRLTFERSYLARLNYVHQNPVKHGLVRVANQYRWCSAAWFERSASQAQVKTIQNFKIDKVKVFDDFDPVLE